jgi:hypothetical protein
VLWQLDDAKKFPTLEAVYADQKYENATVRDMLRRLAPDRKRPAAPFKYPQSKAA